MAVEGKKINQLEVLNVVSNETVLPSVYVNGTTVDDTAKKVSVSQLSDKVQENISPLLAAKQDALTAGENITILNNVISATVGTQSITTISSTSGTIALEPNKVYKAFLNGNTTFTLPTIADNTKFNQIMMQLTIDSSYTIDLGTTHYMGEESVLLAGMYNVYYEYDSFNELWFVGILSKTINESN